MTAGGNPPRDATPDRDDPLSGAFCPLVTPFSDDAPDTESLSALVERTLDAGIDGVVPCGTTGEFASLSGREYATVLETVVECVDSHERDVPVVAGTAETSVAGVLDRIELAADVGADYALVPPPYFHGPNGGDGLERFFRAIVERSELPVVLYNIPFCTGTELDAELVGTLRELDGVHGLKDSSGDFGYFLGLVREAPEDFSVFVGPDTYLVPALLAGADGGVNGLSNVLPGAFAEVVSAVAEGDLERARRVQNRRIDGLSARCDGGYAPTIKAVLSELGVIETADVKVPLSALEAEKRTAITNVVRELR